MVTSDYTCGDCGFTYTIDLDGPVIQPCPRCSSQEMVKAPKEDNVRKK